LETADFLHDLEDTDEAIAAGLPAAEGATPHQLDNGAASPVLGKGTGSVQKTPSSADKRTVDPKQVSATKGSGAKGTLPRTESSSLPIPVAELVVAAHAALLLHTLEGNTSLTSNGGQKLLGNSPQTEQPARAIDALPRGDWWLCVRVLKAFLTLQGQVRSSADAYFFRLFVVTVCRVFLHSRVNRPESCCWTTLRQSCTPSPACKKCPRQHLAPPIGVRRGFRVSATTTRNGCLSRPQPACPATPPPHASRRARRPPASCTAMRSPTGSISQLRTTRPFLRAVQAQLLHPRARRTSVEKKMRGNGSGMDTTTCGWWRRYRIATRRILARSGQRRRQKWTVRGALSISPSCWRKLWRRPRSRCIALAAPRRSSSWRRLRERGRMVQPRSVQAVLPLKGVPRAARVHRAQPTPHWLPQ
jgi:hypothetical protein